MTEFPHVEYAEIAVGALDKMFKRAGIDNSVTKYQRNLGYLSILGQNEVVSRVNKNNYRDDVQYQAITKAITLEIEYLKERDAPGVRDAEGKWKWLDDKIELLAKHIMNGDNRG